MRSVVAKFSWQSQFLASSRDAFTLRKLFLCVWFTSFLSLRHISNIWTFCDQQAEVLATVLTHGTQIGRCDC